MMLVSAFVVFTISLCGANTFECYYYAKSSKSLEIYCDRHQNQLPKNCTRESANPLDVTHLKIEGCDQRTIGDASEKYPNIESLNISQSGYSSLDWTGKTFEKLTVFDASANELTAIPTSILSKFPQLYELRLDENKIEKISAGDFKNANQKLGTISLAKNRLKSIDDNAFASFVKLSNLYLTGNGFSTFPMAVFKSNILAVFLIENTQLKTINCTSIRSMSSNRIHFTWEYITTFDGRCNGNWYFAIENCEFDKFIGNSVDHTTFYCNVGEQCFKNMRYFVAGSRSIGDVSKMLSSLGPTALEKIDVSGNYIESGNLNAFERFHNLSELSLRNTALTAFSFDFLRNQIQLSHLDISQNHLTRVDSPERLQNFTQLTYLNASANEIRNLDEMVRHLPSSVRQLILNENLMAKIDIKSFSRLKNLEELDLHGVLWGITDGESQDIDFAHLPRSLKRLNMQRTKLKRIQNLDRNHFPVLKDLDLSENRLDCDYLDRLRSEFEDADTFRSDECKKTSKFWIIFLAILAISIILFIVILEKVRKFY